MLDHSPFACNSELYAPQKELSVEALVVLLVICVVGYLAGKRGEPHNPKHSQHRPEPSVEAKQRSQAPPLETPPPFQADDATHLDKPRVIEGRARIVDGDTIVINKVQIRLFGIDAPEIDHPYGQKAKWALVSLCKGETVRTEVTDVDSYGRTVGKCYLSDGRDLSAEMVKVGLAIDWPKFSGGEYGSMETSDARKKLWLADARQKGRMHAWESFDCKQRQAKQNEK